LLAAARLQKAEPLEAAQAGTPHDSIMTGGRRRCVFVLMAGVEGIEVPAAASRNRLHERAAVRDDQTLPDLAASCQFINGPGVRFPILGGVDDVGHAPLLQQLHERKPLQTKLVCGLTGGDLPIREEG